MLVFPGDGESDLVREALRGQRDWMSVAQDGLDDVRRQEAEPQDPGEVGPADAGLGGKLRHRLPAVAHHHGMVLVGLGEHPAQAVVGFAARAAAVWLYTSTKSTQRLSGNSRKR